MSSINTVSGNGNKNYVSGLASGMDTESIVKSFLMGTQTKIDKQSGLKQQLEWKQDIYRDLITKINTFSDKYFSYYGSGDTNLMSQSLFKTMTGISSSGAIKISLSHQCGQLHGYKRDTAAGNSLFGKIIQ